MPSGFKKVARMAVTDCDLKMAMKFYCKKNGLSFDKMWKLAKQMRLEKQIAIKNNQWKSRLSTVKFSDDPTPFVEDVKEESHCYKAGRFTVKVTITQKS